ncbi:MAG: hypothetical protein WBG57_13980, partial [Ornithinimicrobium sp.]
GCTIMEVGYRSRGGGDLQDHQAWWDACSRVGIFLTGVGTNDNHTGRDWDKPENNFVTWVWAKSSNPSDVLESLGRGRVFFGDPTLFDGTLDLSIDSGAVMGQVDVAEDHGSKLSVLATGLQEGMSVEVIRLAMEGDPEANEQVPRPEDYERIMLTTSQFSSGIAQVPLPPGWSGLVRAIVLDEARTTIALSNPLWLMTEEPPTEVPLGRRL